MNRSRWLLYVFLHSRTPPRRRGRVGQATTRVTVPGPPVPEPAPEPAPEPPPESPDPTPVALRLIGLRDKVQEAAEMYGGASAVGFSRVAAEIAEILELDRVTAFDDGGTLDPDRQNVVDTIDTDDPVQDHRIAASVRPGYLYGEALIRRQDVIVYRLADSTLRPGR